MDRAERFSDLYQRQYDAVLRYALRRTDAETARDVVAETFLVAWRQFDVVPVESGMAGPWLYGVARRVLANTERSRRRAERLTTRLGQERRHASVPDQAGSIAEIARIRAALATLSEPDQEALGSSAGRSLTWPRPPWPWGARRRRWRSGCTGPGAGWNGRSQPRAGRSKRRSAAGQVRGRRSVRRRDELPAGHD